MNKKKGNEKNEVNNSYFNIYPIIFLPNGKSINSKSFPIANVYKSLNLLSDILSRALFLMSFILLKVRSVVLGETGMIIARMRRDIIVRNAWRNADSSKYKLIMELILAEALTPESHSTTIEYHILTKHKT